MTDRDNTQPPKIEPGRGVEAELTDTIGRTSARKRPLAGTIDVGQTGSTEQGTWKIEQGADVLTRDGDKLGDIVEIRPGYIVVEEGFFDPRDLYIPLEFIAEYDETQLVLSITREMFEASDWTDEPDVEEGRPEKDV